MTNQEAIEISLHDLKFIRDGYKNLAENGADNMRAVGKGVDCKVECKTYKELYEHYVKSLDMAIKALEKQIPKIPMAYKVTNRADCPICGKTVRGIDKPFGNYCNGCGQKLDWSEEE